MFRREAHRIVEEVLGAFRANVLARCRFLFGGGTRIVLELDEYRESHDIDFLCSDAEGYAELRFEAATRGYPALFAPRNGDRLQFPREMRIDQYGIRFPVRHDNAVLRVELIREARIELDAGVRPKWSPVDCLSLSDCWAEKLLASSDRWADRQVLSRDLVDLAALRLHGPAPQEAWNKAERAYKSAPAADLGKALAMFLGDPGYQERCFQGLKVEDTQRIRRGLALLDEDLQAES